MSEKPTLINVRPDWEKYWNESHMPPFTMEDLQSWQRLIVHFASREDWEDFAKLVGQSLKPTTRSIWVPPAPIGHFADKKWITDPKLGKVPRAAVINPRCPVYIISKGRWKSRKTARALDKMGVSYKIVVEPQEYEDYSSVIDRKRIVMLPKKLAGSGCSIPARNFVWKHSIERGAERHWILDDNIEGFFRLTDNLKVPVGDGYCFRSVENFVEQYKNIGLAGLNYFMFAPRKSPDIKPFTLNTRIYSCILVRNDLPFPWRGKYNEDTDLSLRVLKTNKECTVLFNAYLAFKSTTMTMKGGNTESLYQGDGRKDMALSLKKQHPDLVTVTQKWGRWQHHVNYSGFTQRLVRRENLSEAKTANNHMVMVEVQKERQRKRTNVG